MKKLLDRLREEEKSITRPDHIMPESKIHDLKLDRKQVFNKLALVFWKQDKVNIAPQPHRETDSPVV